MYFDEAVLSDKLENDVPEDHFQRISTKTEKLKNLYSYWAKCGRTKLFGQHFRTKLNYQHEKTVKKLFVKDGGFMTDRVNRPVSSSTSPGGSRPDTHRATSESRTTCRKIYDMKNLKPIHERVGEILIRKAQKIKSIKVIF
jgi:hypothetical protein